MTRRRPPVRRQDSPVMHTNVASPPDADLGDDAGGGGVRMIPVIGEGYDVCRAACAYAAAGIFVVPIDPRTKNPGSVLGSGWPSKSSRDPHRLILPTPAHAPVTGHGRLHAAEWCFAWLDWE